MNMAYDYTPERDFDDNQEEGLRGGKQKVQAGKRRPEHSTKKTPTSFNGIHRRRNKRFSW
jgi:hypothetical protein